MTRTQDQLDAEKGRQAGEVLNNPSFVEAMAQLKAQVNLQWRESSIRDAEGQKLLLQMARVTDEFENILIRMLQGGIAAQRKIDLNKMRDEPAARKFFRKVTG
jgi:hypothetical protein